VRKLYVKIILNTALIVFGYSTSLMVQGDIVHEIRVSKAGHGDHTSIQAAIDAAKAFPDKRIAIYIEDGVYHEKVQVYEWNTKLSLIGESNENTLITYGDHFDGIARGRNSTFHTATLQVDGDDFHAENITVENTAGPVGQAIALAVNADRASFYNSRFLGHQDTIYLTGEDNRQYFKNCYIEGTTDFIFGRATAVFDNCQIHSKSDSYITAASTPEGTDHGLVFIGSRLTADEQVSSVYLGRPWRPYAKTVFINSYMGSHIHPKGWHNWSKPGAEATSFYAEFDNQGPGSSLKERVSWQKKLCAAEAKNYTPEHILGSTTYPFWYKR